MRGESAAGERRAHDRRLMLSPYTIPTDAPEACATRYARRSPVCGWEGDQRRGSDLASGQRHTVRFGLGIARRCLIDGLKLIRSLPLAKQLARDPFGLASAARSRHSEDLHPRTDAAERVVKSICPFCAVGCGQDVYVREGRITQIEGDADSPISRGRLCPKGRHPSSW
jgi:hypothetical protein